MKKGFVTLAGVLLALGSAAMAVNIETVPVGNVGNAADVPWTPWDPGRGAVDYAYNIGKYEVSNAEYCAFLNAVARVGDPHILYSTKMGGGIGGISRTGSGTEHGPYAYSTRPNRGNRPVNYVSFWDACRFANWLHNGQPTGAQDLSTTEDGAYFLNDVTNPYNTSIRREPYWKWAVTSEDEWYKAAYYDPGKAGGAGYWYYPTGSNTPPTAEAPPGTDLTNGSANYYDGGYVDPTYGTTECGAYDAKPSDSPYGTLDQGGKVWEWTEGIGSQQPRWSRFTRGGSFYDLDDVSDLRASYCLGDTPTAQRGTSGFRVSELAEPATLWRHDPMRVGDWTNPDNWTEGLSTHSRDANIDNCGTVVISSMPPDAEARNLYVGYSKSGSVIQSGGTTTITKDLRLGYRSGSTGTYDLAGGNLHATNVLLYGGSSTLNVSSGAVLDVADTLAISTKGRVNLSGGTILADRIQNFGTFRFTGGTLQVGTFEVLLGQLTNRGGILVPSKLLGVTTIDGNYEQTAAGELLVGLSGIDGDCHRLTVTGDLRLAGTLGLDWLEVDNDWNSMFGGTFTVATCAGTLTGTFDFHGGGIREGYVANVDYGETVPGEITVTLHDQLYGDAKLDAVVNLSDMVVAIEHWQAAGDDARCINGDVNLDGIVNLKDIVEMIANWQQECPAGLAGPAEDTTVPEPATLSLLALGGLAVMRRRRRRF